MSDTNDDELLKLQKRYVMPALRRISRWWPPSLVALKRAEVKKGIYKCAHCSQVFKRKEVHRDHIHPVVNPSTGFTTWGDLINRLLAPSAAYQILCIDCHNIKTQAENTTRREIKKRGKKA